MKSELDQAISTLKFRDDRGDKYVYDISASRRIGNDIDTIDLVTKEKGVETFKRTVEYARENEFDSIELVIYKNKAAKEKIGTYHIPLSDTHTLGATELPVKKQTVSADDYFGAFGGLSGFMNETRTQIGNQLDLQYAKRDLSRAEAQIVSLESKAEQLAAANDQLRDQIKDYKDRIHDLERDMQYQKNSYEQRGNLLQLAANGVVSFVGSQLGVTPDKLSGLLGIGGDPADSTPSSTTDTANQDLDGNTPKDEKQEYIDAIVQYLYSLDTGRVKMVAAVMQYASMSDAHLTEICKYVNTQNTTANGTENSNATA